MEALLSKSYDGVPQIYPHLARPKVVSINQCFASQYAIEAPQFCAKLEHLQELNVCATNQNLRLSSALPLSPTVTALTYDTVRPISSIELSKTPNLQSQAVDGWLLELSVLQDKHIKSIITSLENEFKVNESIATKGTEPSSAILLSNATPNHASPISQEVLVSNHETNSTSDAKYDDPAILLDHVPSPDSIHLTTLQTNDDAVKWTTKETSSVIPAQELKTSHTWTMKILDETPNQVFVKPLYSHPVLITFALLNSRTGRLKIEEIFRFINYHFPGFNADEKTWKNSIRHNLTMSKNFVKSPCKILNSPKKGWLWSIAFEKFFQMSKAAKMAGHGEFKRKRIKACMRYPEVLDKMERGELSYEDFSWDDKNYKKAFEKDSLIVGSADIKGNVNSSPMDTSSKANDAKEDGKISSSLASRRRIRKTKTESTFPLIPNTSYIRKRPKLNLSLLDLQEDCESDDEWNKKHC